MEIKELKTLTDEQLSALEQECVNKCNTLTSEIEKFITDNLPTIVTKQGYRLDWFNSQGFTLRRDKDMKEIRIEFGYTRWGNNKFNFAISSTYGCSNVSLLDESCEYTNYLMVISELINNKTWIEKMKSYGEVKMKEYDIACADESSVNGEVSSRKYEKEKLAKEIVEKAKFDKILEQLKAANPCDCVCIREANYGDTPFVSKRGKPYVFIPTLEDETIFVSNDAHDFPSCWNKKNNRIIAQVMELKLIADGKWINK